MFCTKCGTELPENSRFCKKCGEPNPSVSVEAEATPSVIPDGVSPAVLISETPAASATVATPDRTKRIAIVSIVAVVLLVAIGALFFLFSSSETKIDESHFPDKNFRAYVSAKVDANNDGMISQEEASAVTTVDLSDQPDVKDVTGISVFSELQSFNLGTNDVEELDLSKNTHVSKVSTENGTTASVKLPSSFNLEQGLSGAADTEVESGDSVISKGDWTTGNEGHFSNMQRYNGTLYAGLFAIHTGGQLNFEGATPFFEESACFYFADGKVYWTDSRATMTPQAASIYSANVDGSDKKTLAQNLQSSSIGSVYYSDGYIFYMTYTGPTRTASAGTHNVACIDTKTGETETLPVTALSLGGICNHRLIICVGDTSGTNQSSGSKTVKAFDPSTKSLSDFPTQPVNQNQNVSASEGGLLVADVWKAKFIDTEGTVLWADKDVRTVINKASTFRYVPLFCGAKDCFVAYPTYGPDNSDTDLYNLDVLNKNSGEFSTVQFSVPEYPDRARVSCSILLVDSEGVYVSLEDSETMDELTPDGCIYYVPLDGGDAKFLQQFKKSLK